MTAKETPEFAGFPVEGQLSSGSGLAGTPPGTAAPQDPSKVAALTYGDYVTAKKPHKTLMEFLVKAGVEDGTDMADVLHIPEPDLMKTIEDLGLPNALAKGILVKAIREMFASFGCTVPVLGAAQPAAAPPTTSAATASSALRSLSALTPFPPPPPPVEVETLNYRDYLDQSLKGGCTPMSATDLAATRARYEAKVDHEPRDASTPTREQLSCPRAAITASRVPYADFAIWNVHGPRLARFQDHDAQVLVGGQLVTKRISGAPSFASWSSSWDLFEVAMVSLGSASVGSLRAYKDGIEQLVTLFPDRWPIIVTTDMIVRTERWSKMRETYDRQPPHGYDITNPWNFIISVSSWGSPDVKIQAWWQRMFILPATLSGRAGQLSLMDRMEGGPASTGSAAFPHQARQDDR